MNNIKLIISAVFLLLLSACGGGDDGTDSNGNSNTGRGGTTYVAGEFKTASRHDEYAPTDIAAYGLSSGICMGEEYYYETANVLVFGSSSLPDDDFQYAATLVENKLNEAFNLMGITRTEFNNYRPQYTPQVAKLFIGFLLNDYIDLGEVGIAVPEIWQEMGWVQRESFLRAYWNNASDDEQTELVDFYHSFFGISGLDDGNKLPRKIGVCLDSSMNEVMYGQGTLLGMNIPPKSIANRSDAEQVVLHELIHTIQHNIGTPVDVGTQVNDLWFMEGQATYLSRQKMASNAAGYYPVNVVDGWDAGQEFGDDGIGYKHYAKAYSYLDINSGKERVLQLLLDVRNYQNAGSNFGHVGTSSDRFRTAFDGNILKANDEQLTLEEFRQNYHSLVK